MANDHHGIEIGKPERMLISQPIAAPSTMPMTPPSEVRNAASSRNCQSTSTPARAERLADADLARALGDADGHDRHHADAADHQRDRGDDDQRQEDARGSSLLPELEQRVLRADVEVALLVEAQAVPGAHDLLDLADRVGLRHVFARDRR